MQLTSNENTFLEMIRKTCIDECTKNNITPSVVAALGIVISNWGTSKIFFNTRNIYNLTVNDKWYGKCYSKDSEKIYDRVEDCRESSPILYRVYEDHRDSIKDFISELVSTRRSENGPLRYESIIKCTEYRETIDKLVRNGFMQYYLNRINDILYIDTLIGIIDRYELMNWDSLLKTEVSSMSKKKYYYNKGGGNKPMNENSNTEIVNEIEEELVDDNEATIDNDTYVIEHMYRVRLDWDRRDTQIFASPSYEDALEAARKHEGYKIYIDDDGELFEDPWENAYNEEEVDNGPRPLLHALQGELVILDNTPVYRSAMDKHPMSYMSGKFYFYDSTVTNGRAKITVHKEIYKRDPSLILGYIKVD